MKRLCISMIALVLAVPAHAEERGRKNVPYSDSGGDRTRLDVYSPAQGQDHPVVVWVHGGGWQRGDKSNVQTKPAALTAEGYVMVGVNYRFHPAVTYKEQAADVAKAIRWVRDHAAEYGGDPRRIFLMGHSAGAHLAALVATDGRYLEREGLKLADLSGVILLDGACYDIPRQIEQAPLPGLKALYLGVFGDRESVQKDASPIRHVARGTGIPPFLILHVARRRDSKAQANELAARLQEAGVEAKVVPAEGKSHMTINRELGQPGDPPTQAMFEFLGQHRKRAIPE